MKKILLTLTMCLMALAGFAQDKMDVVYLKDGRVIKGSIIKPLDADGIQIMTTESDVYTFSVDEVRRVGRESFRHENLSNKIMVHDGTGFTNITTLGYGFGIGTLGAEGGVDNDGGYFAIHTINGYHISRKVSLGAGLGIEWHDGYELVPLYADVRLYPSLTEWAPFFFGNAGYGLGFLDDNADGGLMLGLGGGVQKSVNSNFAYTASLGYRFQENSLGALDLDAHFLQLSVGLKF
ncbi:hypothetical protein [Phaeodactylibacter luteus]|uniref:Porin family protein n=1 Tax=Phaeodactylibacter luteus TaxID=1564516 RepID=A0A5C6RM45_9BACT|nr:hypothetical protein [Phaeodactylibacter luteus]TXB62412.1 hypothetical protein FRY97_14110 [Phaeodactylibacter luteus]